MKHFFWRQGPFLAACVAIFVASSMQDVPQVPLPFLQDKIPHAIVFAVLAVLAFRAFKYQDRIGILSSTPVLSAFLFAVLYGALDEVHQAFVPGRTSDLWDLVADGTGAAIGLVLLVVIVRKKEAVREDREGQDV